MSNLITTSPPWGGEPFSGVIFSNYADGSLEAIFNYKEGLPDGLQEQWYSNGQLERRAMARRGNGSSKIEYWYPNGIMKSLRINDDRNRPVSISEWDEKGNLTREQDFSDSSES